MTPDELKARSKRFAVNAILFAEQIPHDAINDEIASSWLTRRHRRRFGSKSWSKPG